MHWVRAALRSEPEMVQHLVPAARERLGDAQAALTHGSCWQVALRYRSALVALPDAQAFLREAGSFPARSDELWR